MESHQISVASTNEGTDESTDTATFGKSHRSANSEPHLGANCSADKKTNIACSHGSPDLSAD
jgi:hypothetical protein